MRFSVGRIERQRPPVALLRLVALTVLAQRIAEIAERLWPVRPGPQRSTQAFDRTMGVVQQVHCPAAIAPYLRILRPDLQRAIVRGDGIGEAMLALQCVAEIVVRLRVEGVERECLTKAPFGFRRLFESEQHDAQRIVVGRLPAVGGDCLPDQRGRAGMIAGLVGEQSREMQPIGLARLDLQHLAIEMGGLFQAALLVVTDAFAQQPADVGSVRASRRFRPGTGLVRSRHAALYPGCQDCRAVLTRSMSALPVSGTALPEQPHRRVPGAVVAV